MTNDALAPVSNLARATPTAGVVWLVVLALGAALTLLAIEVAGDNVLDADLDVARWAQGIDFFAWHEVLDSVEFATGSPAASSSGSLSSSASGLSAAPSTPSS